VKKSIERYAEKVQGDITDCGCDQPVAEGEVIWRDAQPVEVETLLDKHHVPEQLRDAVAEMLRCPECEDPLSRYSTVGTEWDFEQEHRRRIEAAEARYASALFEFRRHLEERRPPQEHAVGRALLRQIGRWPSGRIADEVWLRTQPASAGSTVTVERMRPPDPAVIHARAGRFNQDGERYWYLADGEEEAATEVADAGDAFVWVQRFRVTGLERVLDLRAWVADPMPEDDVQDRDPNMPLLAVALIYGDHLTNKPEEAPGPEVAYLISRVVADAAKHRGYSGILYRSPRHVGKNLVAFDWRLPFEAVGEPYQFPLAPEFYKRRSERLLIEGFHVGIPDWP
jgi:hypothetical protein